MDILETERYDTFYSLIIKFLRWTDDRDRTFFFQFLAKILSCCFKNLKVMEFSNSIT